MCDKEGKHMDIQIADAVSDDVYGIRRVQKITWLETYPNPALGITKEDIEARYAFDDTEEGKAKMEERKKRIVENPNVYTWVAKDRDEIVGFCMAEREETRNRLGAIYILPNYQGQGVGKKLMKLGLNWLGDDKDIVVNVASYNKQAISFYESFGFVTNRENFYDDRVASLPSGNRIPENEMIIRK